MAEKKIKIIQKKFKPRINNLHYYTILLKYHYLALYILFYCIFLLLSYFLFFLTLFKNPVELLFLLEIWNILIPTFKFFTCTNLKKCSKIHINYIKNIRPVLTQN